METIFSNINPGDVIAFSGNGLDSKIIRWFTRSPYSHVIVVLDTKNTDEKPKEILIAESTTYTTVPNFNEQKCIKGVQVHLLSHWLDAYKTCGKAWWFPLKQKLSQDKITQMQSWLWHHYHSQTPFACHKSVVAGLTRNKYFDSEIPEKLTKTNTGFFCSELVTEALQIAGIINCKINPAYQTPKDLMNLDCFQEPKLIL
ncbi:MAG: hypothetical protein QNJ37_09245 [Crocosphaera sp.]|nr:hypothetical protein [Crocosphaera sp.]